MKKILFLFLFLMCLAPIVGCVDYKKFSIIDSEPNIEPYKTFDIASCLKLDMVDSYSFEGIYTTARGLEKEITFDGTEINVPENNTVAEINIKWNKGKIEKEEKLSLSVFGNVDVIDNGMIELWKEDSIAKQANFNPQYIKEGNSSVKVAYNGYYGSYGTQFSCITAHLSTETDGIYDKDYYDIYKEADQVEAFKDCIFYFWVYNTIQESANYESTDLRIGYRIKTVDGACDIDWNLDDTVLCKAGEWTLVPIRFKNYGITKDLYKDLNGFYSAMGDYYSTFDALNLKVQAYNLPKDGSGKLDTTRKQNYIFYTDGYNMVSYRQFVEMFPDYDIDSIEMGDTWKKNIVGQVDNWYNSGKGISFDFKVGDQTLSSNTFSLLDNDWNRLSDYITLDLENVSATYGTLTKNDKGVYHYELMFKDAAFNVQDQPNLYVTGNETFEMMYFKTYDTVMTINNYKIINDSK